MFTTESLLVNCNVRKFSDGREKVTWLAIQCLQVRRSEPTKLFYKYSVQPDVEFSHINEAKAGSRFDIASWITCQFIANYQQRRWQTLRSFWSMCLQFITTSTMTLLLSASQVITVPQSRKIKMNFLMWVKTLNRSMKSSQLIEKDKAENARKKGHRSKWTKWHAIKILNQNFYQNNANSFYTV